MAFQQHEKSLCHKLGVEKLCTIPATCRNVGEMLCNSLAVEKANNRHCVLKVVSGLEFLARQGCGIWGHDDNHGNLLQLMKPLHENDAKVIILLHCNLQKL